MTALARLGFLALLLPALAGCGAKENAGPGPSGQRLRANIGLDLAQVESFAVSSATGSPSGLRKGVVTENAPPILYALKLSGELLEVSLIEEGNPNATGVVQQPPVVSIHPTASWILFSLPNFRTGVAGSGEEVAEVPCGIIAARRVDGALFCAPLVLQGVGPSGDTSSSVRANAAGDVAYMMAAQQNSQGMIGPDGFRLYRMTLGGAGGPVAATMLPSSIFGLQNFRVNAAGDLYVAYLESAMSYDVRSQVLPIDGGPAFEVQGNRNNWAISGEAGKADENTFYVASGGGGGTNFEGLIRVLTRGSTGFSETQQTVTLPMGSNFTGLYRLSDGGYMLNVTDKSLLRVVADGAVVATPATVSITGVNSIIGGMLSVLPVAGWWVFIADTGSGYEFVRHDGANQQDIPIEAGLEIRSFTVSSAGAIDFLGIRTGTLEKVRGAVAAGSTAMTITAAGALDPDQVIAFTRIN